MKYCMAPLVAVSELEEAIKIQYGVELNIEKLFWGHGTEYEELYYDCEYGEDEIWWYGENAVSQMNLVFSFLRDTIPDYRCIIVNLGC